MLIQRFKTTPDRYFARSLLKQKRAVSAGNVFIDIKKLKQTHLGCGGAFSPSSGVIYDKLPEREKKRLLDLYFSDKGLRYNLGRIAIGSCDFAPYQYDCVDDKGRIDLSFDERFVFPFIKDAKRYRGISLVASCWSPLAKYKTNGEKANGGYLKDDAYVSHAAYLLDYVAKARSSGLPIDYLTMQNEPLAKQVWESCLFTAQAEAKLVRAIAAEKENRGLGSLKLLVWDHNRDIIVARLDETFADHECEKETHGIAFHDYDRTDAGNLSLVHEKHPGKPLFFTEGCVEFSRTDDEYKSGAKKRYGGALYYIKSLIENANNWTTAFIDWNLLLDSNGGPNHVANYCEAPVMFDEHKRKLIVNPSYYAIKHFAHFVDEDARAVDVTNLSPACVCAYLNPDGSLVVIVLNNAGVSCNISIIIENKEIVFDMEPDEIDTVKVEKQ